MIIDDPFSIEQDELINCGFTFTIDMKHFAKINSVFITHYYFFTEKEMIDTYIHISQDGFAIHLDKPLKLKYTTHFKAFVLLDDIISIHDSFNKLVWNYQYNIPCNIDIKELFPELISCMESAMYLHKLCKG